MATEIKLPFATSHAFIVGINDYEHISSLKTAVNDARVLAGKLKEDHGYLVHPPLLNANKAQLEELFLETIPHKVSKDDRVLFYFAGHGIALNSDDNPKGYFVPTDASPEEAETLVSMDLLHDIIDKLPCKHGLLIMDCCFAGSFKWSTGFRDVLFDLPSIIYEQRFYQYAQDPAWQVITSSASDQKAVDILSNRILGMRENKDEEHSPFARALFDGLDGEADTVPKGKGDGLITTTELYTYLRDRVEDETMEHGMRQSPAMFSLHKHDKGQYIFLHPRHPLNLPPIPKRNPFMGLNAYEEADSFLFFGRDRVIEALDKLSEASRMVVVSGVSGTGKSSVIKAGLLPLLRKRAWQMLPIIRPGAEPMQNLQEAIPDIKTLLHADHPSVLVVDQYEELITQCQDPETWLEFENQLKTWLEKHPDLHIVISIRSDFEPQFENGVLADWWKKGHYIVPAFSQDELREVIIKPTIQEVLFFEEDILVDKLVDAVNQAPGALPLLSFTLSELYHAYINSGRTNRAFTLEDYEKLGGVIGALRTRANKIYLELEAGHQDSMRKLMLRMVSLAWGGTSKRRVYENELIYQDDSKTQRVQDVRSLLIQARLLSTGKDSEGDVYTEPAHDALVNGWAELYTWIHKRGKESIQLQQTLWDDVLDYQRNTTSHTKSADIKKDVLTELSFLWDSSPMLLQLFDMIMVSTSTSVDGEPAQALDAIIALQGDLKREEKKNFDQFIRSWKKPNAQPDLDALIMTGISNQVLSILLEKGNHWLNQAESEFIQKSWQRRAGRMESLKLERDEAIQAKEIAEAKTKEAQAATLAAKAREMAEKDPTVAMNLAHAAIKTLETPETAATFQDISNASGKDYYFKKFEDDSVIFTSLTFSPDNKHILSTAKGHHLRLWSIDSGEVIISFQGLQEDTRIVAFTPDGQKIASADNTNNGIIRIWDANTGQQLGRFNDHQEEVIALKFKSNDTLLSGSKDRTVRKWSIGEMQEIGKTDITSKMNKGVEMITFSPDHEHFLVVLDDRVGRLWSMKKNKQVKKMEMLIVFGKELDLHFNVTTFSPDGKKILAGSAYQPDKNAKVGKILQLWNAKYEGIIGSTTDTNKPLKYLEGHTETIWSLAFSPDGEYCLSGSKDNTARLWSTDTYKEINRFKQQKSKGFPMKHVSFSPDNKFILTGGGSEFHLWALEKEEKTETESRTIPSKSKISGLAISEDGTTFLSDYQVNIFNIPTRLWPLEEGAPQKGPGSSSAMNFRLTYSIKDKQLKLYSPELQIGSIFIVRVDIKRLDQGLVSMDIIGRRISSDQYKVFHPDGKRVFREEWLENRRTMQSSENINIQDPSENSLVAEAIAFSPNGEYFLTSADDSDAYLWSMKTGKLLSILAHNSSLKVLSVAFSPDSKHIITGSQDQLIRLWSSKKGTLIRKFEGHTDVVSAVCFSNEGKHIVSGSGYRDLSIRIWDIESGKELQQFSGHDQRINAVTFSADDKSVLSGSNDRSIRVSKLKSSEWDPNIYKFNDQDRKKYGIDVEY